MEKVLSSQKDTRESRDVPTREELHQLLELAETSKPLQEFLRKSSAHEHLKLQNELDRRKRMDRVSVIFAAGAAITTVIALASIALR